MNKKQKDEPRCFWIFDGTEEHCSDGMVKSSVILNLALDSIGGIRTSFTLRRRYSGIETLRLAVSSEVAPFEIYCVIKIKVVLW